MKYIAIFIVIAILLLAVGFAYFAIVSDSQPAPQPAVSPVTTQSPAVSSPLPTAPTTSSPTPSPTVYQDLIKLDSPAPEATVSSPLSIRGEARGTWFFEGSFPVILTDWDGRIIAETYAEAQSEWMTEDYVPFTAEVTFEVPEGTPYNRGALILQKANPSGLPENDDALEITIYFED